MFKISIDDKQDEYFPGQGFVGRVHYAVNDLQYAEIKVALQGEEFAYNSSSATRSLKNSRKQLENLFLRTERTLIHKGNLSVGTYEFPFKLTLPSRIPSSYVGKHGHVKYLVKAYLESHNKERRKDEAEINVFSPIHLNEDDTSSRTGNIYGTEMTIENWFCSHEEIEMEVEMQKSAFIVGEVINVVVTIKNNSHLYIPCVSVKLLMTTVPKIFAGQDRSLSTTTVIVCRRGLSVQSYRRSSSVFDLKVPDTAEIPNFEKCSFFSSNALLEVAAVLNNAANTVLNVKVKIILGHILPDGQSFIPKIQALANHSRAESSTNSAIITPLEYGLTKGVPTSTTTSKKTEGIPHCITPYPTNFDSQIFLRDSSSPNNSLELHQIQLPKCISSSSFKSTNPPYPVEDNLKQISMYPPKASSNLSSSYLPYINPDASTCPYPTDGTSSPLRRRSLPRTPCPYPTNTAPFSKDRPEASQLSHKSSFSAEEFFPYKTKNSETNAPYPPVTNPPYPKVALSDSQLAMNMHVLPPYPVLDDATRRSKPPYPISTSAGYPLEEHLNVAMPMPSRFSSAVHDAIGFAVPTTVPRVQNIDILKHNEFEPSAPLLPSEPTEEVIVVAGQSSSADIDEFPTPPDHTPTLPTAFIDKPGDQVPKQAEEAPPSHEGAVSSMKRKKERLKRQAVLDC